MFLNQLTDKEKDAFLKLAVDAACVNDDFNEDEQGMINQYCQEMGLPKADKYNEVPLQDLIPVFSNAEISHKRIVVFELLGLLIADGEFDQMEKAFIHEFALSIGLPDSDVDKQTKLLDQYMNMVKKIAAELFS